MRRATPSRPESERHPRRGEDAGRHQPGHRRRGRLEWLELFQVVKDKKKSFAFEVFQQTLFERKTTAFAHPEHGGDLGQEQRGIVDTGQGDDEDAVVEICQRLGGRGQRQARLADAAGTR